MPKDVVLPELAESVVEGEVTAWLVEVGAYVDADEPLVEVMTDKVTVELPSPFGGVLVDQVAAVGDVVAVGAVLGRIDDAASDAAPAQGDQPGDEGADEEDRGDERSLFRADTSTAVEPMMQVRRRQASEGGGGERAAPAAARAGAVRCHAG